MNIKTGDIVQFTNPMADEITADGNSVKMQVLEVNGERALVVYLVGMRINPTGVIMLKDVTPAKHDNYYPK